jgi:LmbE family N-acetylglucosaminyl deacetylase
MSNPYIPERAMLLYAHPDDIEFSAGGTAAMWASNGCEVSYVLITDGNIGSHDKSLTPDELTTIRHAEQRAAAELAGVKRCIFMGYHDGLLEPTLQLRRELVKLIRRYRPNVVVCGDPRSHFPTDTYINHPDHRAAATAVVEAVFPASEMRLLYPEFEQEGIMPHKPNYVYISGTSDANLFIDISEFVDIKIEALRKHMPSQFPEWDPEPTIRAWAKDVGSKVGYRYAERFRRFILKEIESVPEARS